MSFSRVSVSVTFLSSGRGAGDARRHGRKRTSSRVFCFHYLLAKRKRCKRRAKARKEKESHASLPRVSPVSITFQPSGRRGRRAKAWKEKEFHASPPRASSVSITF